MTKETSSSYQRVAKALGMIGKEKKSYGNLNRLRIHLTNCSLAAILQTTSLYVATVLTGVHFFNKNTQPQFCLRSVSQFVSVKH